MITNLPLRIRTYPNVQSCKQQRSCTSEISHPGAVLPLEHAHVTRRRAPTGARSRHQKSPTREPCSHWSTLTSAHVLQPAPPKCVNKKGLSNPTRKAHSLTQRRSAATSAGVWDSAVHSSHVPRPTQLKPRYAPPTTQPYLMSRAPAGSLTQTHTLRRRVAAVSHVLTMVPASLSSG